MSIYDNLPGARCLPSSTLKEGLEYCERPHEYFFNHLESCLTGRIWPKQAYGLETSNFSNFWSANCLQCARIARRKIFLDAGNETTWRLIRCNRRIGKRHQTHKIIHGTYNSHTMRLRSFYLQRHLHLTDRLCPINLRVPSWSGPFDSPYLKTLHYSPFASCKGHGGFPWGTRHRGG